MNLVRERGESQRAFVGRMLREHGEVRVYDLVYNSRYPDGSPCSLTRTATHIWSLRHEDGLDIETAGGPGDLAVYRLHDGPRPAPVAPAQPAWQAGWRCATCGSAPASEPSPLLGGMGQAMCPACGQQRLFRKPASAA